MSPPGISIIVSLQGEEKMTEETRTPDLAGDLLRIHRVITRAIQVGLDTSARYAAGDLPDEATRAGFFNYVHSLTELLHSHHSGEDTIAFPVVEERIPGAPVGQLCADHAEITTVVERIKQLLETARAGLQKEGINSLHEEFEQLSQIWNRHIHLEEDVLSARAIAAAFQKYEEAEINGRLAEHGQKAAGPDYLVLPFILYNLDGQDRLRMAEHFPPVVLDQLIPVVWAEKWSSMKPFLLA